jgi:hypothetical protein
VVGVYAAFATAAGYTLQESGVHCRLYPPAAGGAAARAWAQVLITSPVEGLDAVFEVNAATGELTAASRTGYADPDQVVLSYDPFAHAWLRIRESSGDLLWDTSPDGVLWTNRRTAPSPAWVGRADLQLQLLSHRDDGVDGFAEFDSFNTAVVVRPGRVGPLERGLAGPFPYPRNTTTVRGA